MKIAIVAYLHGAGGAEKQAILLANYLSLKNEVFLVILAENNCKYDISDRIRIIDLSKREKKGIKIIQRYSRLKSFYKKIRPNVTIHYWFQSVYLTYFVKKMYCGSIIYAERGDPSDSEYSGLLGFVRKKSLKIIDGLVFQTVQAREAFIDNNIKSAIIENPLFIDTERYCCPSKQRNKTVINVGRLHEQKNQRLLIESFKMVHNILPQFSLEIYGDGDLKDELIDLIKKNNLQDAVSIHSSVKSIMEIMYNSSLFVLTSNYEGMPNALMEAMALGVPCISTNYSPGGVTALIDNNINGIIVPKNDRESLFEAMMLVLKNDAVFQSLADNAFNTRYKFSPNVVFEKWDKFLELIISGGKYNE